MLTNCILWAYGAKRKRGSGDVYWRVSRWGWFPHCLYGDTFNGRLRLVSYKPDNPRKRLLPPLLFKGRVRWGDGK